MADLSKEDCDTLYCGAPNEETIRAIRQANTGTDLKEYRSFRELRESNSARGE